MGPPAGSPPRTPGFTRGARKNLDPFGPEPGIAGEMELGPLNLVVDELTQRSALQAKWTTPMQRFLASP